SRTRGSVRARPDQGCRARGGSVRGALLFLSLPPQVLALPRVLGPQDRWNTRGDARGAPVRGSKTLPFEKGKAPMRNRIAWFRGTALSFAFSAAALCALAPAPAAAETKPPTPEERRALLEPLYDQVVASERLKALEPGRSGKMNDPAAVD